MKILFAGGGSGGHFYPLIAVAQKINKIVHAENLLEAELYFMSDSPYDERALFDNDITFKKIYAGKLRRYFSFQNIIDIFKAIFTFPASLLSVFKLFPDVIFSKGGYASFPIVLASAFLHIPLIIHESDSVPGKANLWASKIAERIAVSYPETIKYFPKEKTAWIGNPVREEVLSVTREGSYPLLQFDPAIATVFIMGGSLGARRINETIIATLPKLVSKFQVIHQTGKTNFKVVRDVANLTLKGNPHANRYRVFDYLDNEALRMAGGAADLIISRAGSTIFEIALWHKPSIIIPITESAGDHQRMNANLYGSTGAAVVVEESNLTPNILFSEIDRLLSNPMTLGKMSEAAETFARPDAAEKVAREILNIALAHES